MGRQITSKVCLRWQKVQWRKTEEEVRKWGGGGGILNKMAKEVLVGKITFE